MFVQVKVIKDVAKVTVKAAPLAFGVLKKLAGF